MKISDICCKVMNVSKFSNWIFFVMRTDKDIVGYGEATLDGHEKNVESCLRSVKVFYTGKDPVKENLHQAFKPVNIVEAAVLSAIDMCLWDLKGKYFNVPVSQLFDKQRRSAIPMYATFNRALKKRTCEEFAEVSAALLKQGFGGIKCAPFDDFTWQTADKESERYLERGMKRFCAIRAAVGAAMDVRVDCHWRFNYHYGLRVAEMLKEYDPYWYEAPISEQDGGEISRLRQKISLPIAGAEMQYDSSQLDTLYKNNALDIYMFDIKYIGGITGMLTENSQVIKLKRKLAPHNMTGPVATAANLQICSVIENLDSLELHIEESDKTAYLSDLDTSLHNGCMTVPDRPGLGVELDLDVIDRNPYQPTIAFRANMLGA